FLHPGVAHVAHPAERIRVDPARLVHLAHEARLVADLAGPMPRAGPVGDAAVEGNAGKADIDGREILDEGRAHECRYPQIPRPHHRVREFRVGEVSFHSSHHEPGYWTGCSMPWRLGVLAVKS